MKDKIDYISIDSLLYFIMKAGYIGIGINNIVLFAKVDSYLCAIIGSIIGIFVLMLYFKLIDINPNWNINDLINNAFGKKIGFIINIIFISIIGLFTILLFYDLTNFIGSEYLYDTPMFVISFFGLIPIIYLITKNLKIIGRVSTILFSISFILFIFSILALFFQMKFDNLLPFLEYGINPVVKGTISYVSYSILPILLLTTISKNQISDFKKYKRSLFISYSIFSIGQILTITIILSVLGINLASLYQYPDYHVLRRIAVGGFIERIESLLAIQWVLCIYVMLTCCLYTIKNTISKLFQIKLIKLKWFDFVFPLILVTLDLFIFPNNTMADNFDFDIFPPLFLITMLSIFITTFIINKIKSSIKTTLLKNTQNK